MNKNIKKVDNIDVEKLESQIWDQKGWLSFDGINKLGYFLNIVVTDRGVGGKTFNALEFIIDEYIKYGKTSGWIFSLVSIVDEFRYGLSHNNKKQYPKKWQNFKETKKGIVDKTTGKMVCRFIFMPRFDKYQLIGEQYPCEYLFYDEYNGCLRTIKRYYNDAIKEIVNSFCRNNSSLEDPIKLFLLGNKNRDDMKHPLLTKFDIFFTNESFQLFKYKKDYIRDSSFILVYAPYTINITVPIH